MIEPASTIEAPPQSTNWQALTALRDLCDRPARELELPEEEREAFRLAHGGLPDPCVMKAIGAVLIRWATMGTGASKPSLAAIADSIGRSKRCVRRNLRGLERFGVIRLTLEARRKKRQPRTYGLIVGRRIPGDKKKPGKVAAIADRDVLVLQRAYERALERAHGVGADSYEPCSVDRWAKYARACDEHARRFGGSLPDVAGELMRDFMKLKGFTDERLADECHPPGWLDKHLAPLMSGLRRRAQWSAFHAGKGPAPPSAAYQGAR